jgi:hypothetical protein
MKNRAVMNRVSRIVPVVTVSAAAVTEALAQIGVLQLTVAEQVIVGLLALLAIDAFAERMGILRRIEAFICEANSVPALGIRRSIPKPDEFAKNASTIDILAVSAFSVVPPHTGFYRERIDHGCRIRVLVVDPDSAGVGVHARQSHLKQAAQPEEVCRMHIQSTIAALAPLLKSKKVQLGLSPIFAPFSLFAVDREKDSGATVVEFHTYRTDLDGRPHVVLARQQQAHWFDFFRKEFETMWDDSRLLSYEEALAYASHLGTVEGVDQYSHK